MKNVNISEEKRFGNLTVKKRVSPPEHCNPRYSYWECVCDCGKIKIAKGKNLVSGDCVSCGCKRKSRYEQIPGAYFGAIKQRVRIRGMEYNISPEYVWNLYLEQNKKCVLTGMDIGFDPDYRHGKQSASLDRIDPARGYVVGNVRWVHKKVNQIKMDMLDDEFLEMCRKVVNHMEKR